jgi:hypothetical protein
LSPNSIIVLVILIAVVHVESTIPSFGAELALNCIQMIFLNHLIILFL